jgi:bla regulator protein BlaR1
MELQTAIYTTLLHSLWMGLVLALITSVIIVLTKKQSASIRYNLLTAALLIFVISSAFVFFNNLSVSDNHKRANLVQNLNVEANSNEFQTATNNSYLNNAESIVNFWGNYANQIVLIWFLIICAKSIQLLMGLHGIRYIKTNKIFNAGSAWEQKVADISKKLNITKPVLIFQSGLAKVPMIIGHFKPVILIPLGLFNGLGLDEVEAIISHELAHLKRADYLVNIIQNFVEIIFFFNPGVLWISKLIREERENCCDDLALSCIESKHQYIKALIQCQEFSDTYPNYAMAIIGRKHSLKDRVSRMVYDSNTSLNKLEKTFISIALVSVLIFATAFTKVRNYVKKNEILTVKEAAVLPGNNLQDSIKKTATKKTSKVVHNFSNRSIIQKRQSRQDLEDARAYQQDIIKYQEDVKKYQADIKRQQNQIKTYQLGLLTYQKELKTYQSNISRYAADPKNNKLPTIPVVPAIPATPVAPSVPIAPIEPNITTVKAMAGQPIIVTVNQPMNIAVPVKPFSGKTSGDEKDGDMTGELRKQGLLKDLKNFEYTLTEDQLTINGVRQTAAVHKKYMKYLKNKKGTITTTVSTD